MTSQGTAHGRFQRAIECRHLFAAEMAVREMDHVSLAGALTLTLLIGKQAPERYERAAVRWHTLFVQQAKGIGLAESQLASRALKQQELLREQNRLLEDQNRLLAGLPPHTREEVPSVIRGTRSGGDAR